MQLSKILLIHPGTQYSHQLAKQLLRKKILLKFITGYVIFENSLLLQLIKNCSKKLYKKIANRIIDENISKNTTTFPINEFISLFKIKLYGYSEESFFYRNLQFQKNIKNSYLKQSNAVIGFDTSSFFLIDKCVDLNIPFFLDVSIAHSNLKNSIYSKIVKQYPLWNQALEFKPKNLLAIEQYELDNASHIIVASNFSKKSLIDNGVAAKKISVNAYGIDLVAFPFKESFPKSNTINFIFTGLVDARKGIPFLLDVFQHMNKAKTMLSIVGPIQKNIHQIIRENFSLDNIDIVGKLPHAEMAQLLRKHHVYIFPSYFEGFALVILEAMASGLPVITTTATAGPDIIENGIEGFIIEPGDKEGLRTAINFFIENPSQIEIMGRAARKKAEQYSWDAYGDRWEKIIHNVIEKTNG